MPPRQMKEVFVIRTDRPDDLDDMMRPDIRFPFQKFIDRHMEPEVTAGVTLDEVLERLVEFEDKLRRVQRMQRSFVRAGHTKQKLVIIKELSHEQARKMVEDYIREHGKADTEELMDLGIELKLLVGIIDELKAEGKIGSAEDDASS